MVYCTIRCYTLYSTHFLYSEAEKQELINAAQGAAEAVIAAGRARAESIALVSESLCKKNGQNAASLAVAEKYVGAFENLARTNNTLILPANAGDVTGMVAQAMTVFKQLSVAPGTGPEDVHDDDESTLAGSMEHQEGKTIVPDSASVVSGAGTDVSGRSNK